MCFVRKGMDWLFTQEELVWLDDIMPEAHHRSKEDAKKRKEAAVIILLLYFMQISWLIQTEISCQIFQIISET